VILVTSTRPRKYFSLTSQRGYFSERPYQVTWLSMVITLIMLAEGRCGDPYFDMFGFTSLAPLA
jgi:hypothetical protein